MKLTSFRDRINKILEGQNPISANIDILNNPNNNGRSNNTLSNQNE